MGSNDLFSHATNAHIFLKTHFPLKLVLLQKNCNLNRLNCSATHFDFPISLPVSLFSELRKLARNLSSAFGSVRARPRIHTHVCEYVWVGFFTYETKPIEVTFKNHRCAFSWCDANWNFKNGTKCSFSHEAKIGSTFHIKAVKFWLIPFNVSFKTLSQLHRLYGVEWATENERDGSNL